jgi:hypothetical protein
VGTSAIDVSTSRLDQVGPVRYLIVEFRSGSVPPDAFHELLGLAQDDRVRILDLEFVVRDAAAGVALADPDSVLSGAGEELSSLAGVSSGLLDAEDVTRIGELIAEGSIAAVVMYEDVWLTAMAARLEAGDATLISLGEVPFAELDALLHDAGS